MIGVYCPTQENVSSMGVYKGGQYQGKEKFFIQSDFLFIIFSAAFIVTGVAIVIDKFGTIYYDVGWSLALAIAAAVCTFVSGILSLLELCTK